MQSCAGCDAQHRQDNLAPYQRNADGTFAEACRSCITTWCKLGTLWQQLPFWARKEGLDNPYEAYTQAAFAKSSSSETEGRRPPDGKEEDLSQAEA